MKQVQATPPHAAEPALDSPGNSSGSPPANHLAGHDGGVRRLRRLAASAERRMRFGRALKAWSVTLTLALFGAAVVLAFAKTGRLADPLARKILAGLLIAPFFVGMVAWFRRLAPFAGAIALDREAKLSDRITTALSFSKDPNPDPWKQAAIADGVAHAAKAKPSRAVKIAIPEELLASLALAGVVAAVAVLEIRQRSVIAPYSPMISAVELNTDDLDALADFGNQLKDTPHADAEMKAAVEEFNKLIEDLKAKRIERNEAFRRMAELDTKLKKAGDLDKKALEDALKKVGAELKKNDLTKEAGAAFEKGDKKTAEKKLKELAAKLKSKDVKLSEEQKAKLAEALKKAAARDREKTLAEMKAARDKVAAELEKMRAEKEKAGGKESAEREKERKSKERALERLDREEKELASADRQLEKLDRNLDKAAADLFKDLGLSAADLDAGAEDVNRIAEDEMTAEEKEELRQRIKELHDLLVQQGKLTPEQIEKLKEFMKKAKGGKSGKGKKKKPGKAGKPGDAGDPSKGDGDKGDDGDDKDGDGDGDGDKPGGDKPGGLTLGPGGKPIPIPGAGGAPGGAPGAGGEPSRGPGHGTGPGGKPLGAKTPGIGGAKTDISVAGADAGGGPKRSEVILGAADKGFVVKGYKKVYSEYKTVAEEALKQDEIPAGYRFYVRRYFDLIRPRD